MAGKLEGGAFLSSFVNVVLNKLSSILEYNPIPDRELFRRLQKSLLAVRPVLDDADHKQFKDQEVNKWLVNLQDALYMADDLVDELTTKAATATQRDPGNSSWFRYVVDWYLEDIDMEHIVSRLESIVELRVHLHLEEIPMEDMSWRAESTSLLEGDIYGRDKEKEEIIEMLLDDGTGDGNLSVISVEGMGGVGKTTLAQLIYNDDKVVEKFDIRAWVCVATKFDPVIVTKAIIEEITSSSCSMISLNSLQTELKKKLTGNTFLVVLDDVWNNQQNLWDNFVKPCLCGNKGSKILLTTRNENVDSVVPTTNLHYKLDILSMGDCWSMFLKHSSLSTNCSQYTTLESIGRKIVKKCRGLPLAVKTLGGLLRNKYKEEDWKIILESEIWELSEDDSKIVPALRNCRQLEMLPCRMQELVNLHHLDIEGASCLKEMPKGMSKLKHLNLLERYIVGEHEENGIKELATLDNLQGSLGIVSLENVSNGGEAFEAKMSNKEHINILELKWLTDGDIVDFETERGILEKLQPHRDLKVLSIMGYRGDIFPEWLGHSSYTNMRKLTLGHCKNCCELPSLGQLPYLQHLELFELDGLERIGCEFYKNDESLLKAPFKSLESLTFKSMPCWKEWNFPDEFNGFPQLKSLSMKDCRVLTGDLPNHLPSLEQLTIWECEEFACSLPRAPKLYQLHVMGVSVTDMITKVAPQWIVIEGTQLAESILECLAHTQAPRLQSLAIGECSTAISISGDYFPASLQQLEVWNCRNLTFSGQLQHKMLMVIHVYKCDSLTLFSLGDLPNLSRLTIDACRNMECVLVPQHNDDALPSLVYLEIKHCPRLVSLSMLGLSAPHLEELHIEACPEIKSFPEGALPPSMKSLWIDGCPKLA
ncbi:hypothetical protein PIB30_064183 [Stylosanthes scabra]|uniref:Disease resistance RPP13-like protein 1 n=1 Tax=Stylosanthes scabra TaxID=79078 RepID=A0ABU6QMH4_9FABA|nr:hypothetical protein [Stylosanthes scabra]